MRERYPKLFLLINIFSVLSLVAVTFLIVVHSFGEQIEEENILMRINCCDGSSCTDTYYDQEENLCHLVICEQTYGVGNEDCVYDGKNKSWENVSLIL